MIAEKLFKEIDGKDITEVLSDMVSIPSYDGEFQIVEYIISRLEKAGIKYEITEVAPNSQNIIASIGEAGKTLILNSHTDTVPPGDMDNWKEPPLTLTRKGDKLFGLGSCDAKGSLVSMLIAFETLAEHAHFLKGRLILQAVCCEESRARGTLAEVGRGIIADAAIIGEPTDLIPMIGHKGGLGLEVTILGKAAHGSAPEEGINAISKMTKLIQALEELAEEIFARRDPLFGHASLAITQIQGGQAPNVIPDRCMIRLDRRLIPGESLAKALGEIKAVVEREESKDESLKASIKEIIGIEPCRISSEEPIVNAVNASIFQATGRKPEVSGFPACCDMWCLTQKAHIPAVILGPGKVSMAHKANEYIDAGSLYEAAKIYTAIALNWLG